MASQEPDATPLSLHVDDHVTVLHKMVDKPASLTSSEHARSVARYKPMHDVVAGVADNAWVSRHPPFRFTLQPEHEGIYWKRGWHDDNADLLAAVKLFESAA